MRSIMVPIFLLGYYIALVACEGYNNKNKDFSSINNRINDIIADRGTDVNAYDNTDEFIDKRAERYAFGLGRRAYTYTSGGPGVKRLPIYNFGLGKRASRPYSFGLGKRNVDDNDEDYQENQDVSSLYDSSLPYNHIFASLDNKYEGQEIKRGRPYSFGLGKRGGSRDDVERRSAGNGNMQRYSFGLGKR